jgi:hypothetical protein
MTKRIVDKPERHPFRVNYGKDPEIRDYMSHLYSIQGQRGEQGPALSPKQLEQVPVMAKRFEKIVANKKNQSWDNVLTYIRDHVALFSGFFCGGTTFATNFLKGLGIRAGHEQIFSYDGTFYFASMVGTQLDVEVSGGIAPWLNILQMPRGEKQIDHVTVVRHPVDMINSRYYFNPPKTPGNTLELQRDVATQLELNFGALPLFPWRIESEEDQTFIVDLFNRKPKKGELETARNAPRNSKKKKDQPPILQWDDLLEPLKDFASDLGYDKNGLVK